MNANRVLLEIACDTVPDAVAAAHGGADRLELCSALSLDGLTPSLGMVRGVLSRTDLPTMAMVRPRAGDFVYTAVGLETMELDAELLLAAGASGIVFGCLTAERRIDVRACERLVAVAGRRQTVFHRAFDRVQDPLDALELLVDLGITRVLTSGGARTALDGVDRIAALVERAAGRIEILPGGGVRETNVEELVRRTGCTQVHLSRR